MLEQTYAVQSRARTVNTRIALAMTRKGNLSISEYVTKMKALADEMASARKPIDEEELVSYILAGLDEEYNLVVSALVAQKDSVSVGEAYSQLLNFESRMALLYGGSQPSANVAARRGRGGSGPRGRGRNGRFNPGRSSNSNAPRGCGGPGGHISDGNTITCQVCDRTGHSARKCWYRYDEDNYSNSNSKSAAAAMHSYGVDTNWYTDTAATDHLTSQLDKLTTHEKYKGTDQIHTASGAGMNICNVGHAVIDTPTKPLHLNNILHVPTAQKSLVSVHRFSSDNHASLEYFPNHFLIKDLDTRKVLLQGRCRDGLYPLPSDSSWRGHLAPSSPLHLYGTIVWVIHHCRSFEN